ncbi:MAG: response regulator, partial [Deltaproteobacteria bacterium]|nr:response regulator [Deltaproteobacteria bacterium]
MASDGSDRSVDALAQTRHDLRNHVNQILGYSELLEEESQEAGFTAAVPTLQKIQTAARRQLDLIETLRSGSSPERAPSAGLAPPPPPATPRAEPAQGEAVEPGEEMDGGRVLVVDDNEMNRDMLQRRLQGRGFAVQVAEDGGKALELLSKGELDLVVLDVMMPGISGLDVLVALRKTRSPSDLPVIMATARDTSENIVEALRLGANDYVTKPIDFPVVLARVRTQVALKRQSDRIRQLMHELDLRNRVIKEDLDRTREELDLLMLLSRADELLVTLSPSSLAALSELVAPFLGQRVGFSVTVGGERVHCPAEASRAECVRAVQPAPGVEASAACSADLDERRNQVLMAVVARLGAAGVRQALEREQTERAISAERGSLTAALAHEANSPLGALIADLGFMQSELATSTDADLVAASQQSLAAAKRIAAILKQLRLAGTGSSLTRIRARDLALALLGARGADVPWPDDEVT